MRDEKSLQKLDIASPVSRETEQVGTEVITQPVREEEAAVVSMACSWSQPFNLILFNFN